MHLALTHEYVLNIGQLRELKNIMLKEIYHKCQNDK